MLCLSSLGAVFAGVMPKIIRILEMLEAFVKIRDERTTEITNLGSMVDELQLESLKKDEKQDEVSNIILINKSIVVLRHYYARLCICKLSCIHGCLTGESRNFDYIFFVQRFA